MSNDFLNNVNDNETEEECKARLQKIREDAKSGRKYYPPEPQPYTRHAKHDMEFDSKVQQMSELIPMDWSAIERLLSPRLRHDPYERSGSFHERYAGGMPQMAVLDECHYIDPEKFWISEYKSEPKEKDWERKTFKSGGPTTPSDAVRLKRRAERKAKKSNERRTKK